MTKVDSDRLTARVVAVCDAVGAFIDTWGFRAIHGRVWALLALRNGAMSQAEIAETLGVSRSLVNLAVAELSTYGLVRAVGEGKNAPYAAVWDVWPTITDVLRGREWLLMERARLALESALVEAEAEGSASKFDPERIRLLLSMTEFAQGVLRAILAVRMPRSFDQLGRWLGRTGKAIRKLEEHLGRL